MDTGLVDCVSIEAGSEVIVSSPEGRQPVGLRYEGLAFLDQDALPGIPLTRIMALEQLTESIFEDVEHLELNIAKEVKPKVSENLEKNGSKISKRREIERDKRR